MSKKFLNLLLAIMMLAVFAPTALAAPPTPTPTPKSTVKVWVAVPFSPSYRLTFEVVAKNWWGWKEVESEVTRGEYPGLYKVSYPDSASHLEWEWKVRFDGKTFTRVGGGKIPIENGDFIILPPPSRGGMK